MRSFRSSVIGHLSSVFCLLISVICLLSSVFCPLSYANNIRVENVRFYKTADQPTGTMDIKFDLAWDNSYSGTDANAQAFFDRAWVFVKFWKDGWDQATQPWKHATLTTGGTLTTYSAATHTGISADNKGAFASPGINQTVRWNYSADGISILDTVNVRAMAIEMVRIPSGSFDLGDGNATAESTYAFHVTDNTKAGIIGTTLLGSIKVDVNTNDDDQIELTGIGIKGDAGLDIDNNGTIDNASFPTGYNAFYIMKYEISQGQYRDFLNMLSRTQQNTRIGSQAASQFTMSNTATLASRNGIRNPASIPAGAITFGVDGEATPDGIFNESNDGEWRAAGFLTWMDLAAFADWAGLRPMTELEFEKALRGGGNTAVYQEWAGGDYATIDYFSDLLNDGQSNEAKGAARSGANCNYSSGTQAGPVRCGMFATSSSTREQAGASYYGVMELSGNLWERTVTVGNSTGRAFTGTHGNGALTSDGYADNADWPGYVTGKVTGATGSGFRGGSFRDDVAICVSNRNVAAVTWTGRSYSGGGVGDPGGRGVRTSP